MVERGRVYLRDCVLNNNTRETGKLFYWLLDLVLMRIEGGKKVEILTPFDGMVMLGYGGRRRRLTPLLTPMDACGVLMMLEL